MGARFGTVGAAGTVGWSDHDVPRGALPRGRAEASVTFAKDIRTDLSRRDFTINAMAVRLPDGQFVDPFEGVKDLGAKLLDTPLDPEVAFADDPLRMLERRASSRSWA